MWVRPSRPHCAGGTPAPTMHPASRASYRGRVSQLGGSVCRLPLPSPVLPEVLLGMAPHISLEHLRVASDHAIHVELAVARVFHRDLLEEETKPAVPLAQ